MKLPSRLHALFWDYKFEDLTWETDHDFIVDRVLTVGDWDSIKWLWSRLGDEGLKEWVASHHQKLSPRQLRFWEVMLGLPHKRVSEWLAVRQGNLWEKRTSR
jgi:hypothetical protein